MAATPVMTARQAWAWVTYWRDLRRVPVRSFILAEYLPGRDFAVQSLWRGGRLMLIKSYERLAYVAANAQPSGVSSIAAIAKTVVAPRVVAVAAAAVRALDRRACGAYSVDLKMNAADEPCVTEINVGRFISGTPLFDLTGRHNMALTYVRLALGQPCALGEPYDQAQDDYMVRDLDTLPAIFRAEAFFDGINEARW
jgi:carbamoyl-phosphate synthase large subunit